MPPRKKTTMRLMEDARERAKAHARRAKGLQRMASQLSTLCAVPVGLVCPAAAGAGAPPVVWESEEGVIERYRRAVPAEARARHTHRAYLETMLGKERAKLARARHGCPAALNDMSLDEARGLLETIDAALLATGDRMAALGMPAGGGHGPLDDLVQVAPGSSDDAVMPQQIGHDGGNPVGVHAAGFQMAPFHAGNNNDLLDVEQFSWGNTFQMQPGCGGFQCGGGNYSGSGDEMLVPDISIADYNYSGGSDEMLAPDISIADYNYSGGGDEMIALNFANADYNYSGGGDEMLAPDFASADYNCSGGDDEMLARGFANAGGEEMLAPGFGTADYNWPDLTMWHPDELCDAVMPFGCYPDLADGALAPEYSAQIVAGGDHMKTLPSGYNGYPMTMGVGDNFTDMENNYTAHWQF